MVDKAVIILTQFFIIILDSHILQTGRTIIEKLLHSIQVYLHTHIIPDCKIIIVWSGMKLVKLFQHVIHKYNIYRPYLTQDGVYNTCIMKYTYIRYKIWIMSTLSRIKQIPLTSLRYDKTESWVCQSRRHPLFQPNLIRANHFNTYSSVISRVVFHHSVGGDVNLNPTGATDQQLRNFYP